MRIAALGGLIAAVGAAACGAGAPSPTLAERMAEQCTTIAGCEQLLAELTAERNECLVGRRPVNCEEREKSFVIVRQHLRQRREEALARAHSEAIIEGAEEREASKDALSQEHAELAAKPLVTAIADAPAPPDTEAAWNALDPKRCALQGDEDACYAIFRFLSTTGESPHRAEATAALEAGRKLIEERQKQPASSPSTGPTPKHE